MGREGHSAPATDLTQVLILCKEDGTWSRVLYVCLFVCCGSFINVLIFVWL